jgi:hypothetical protein
MKHQALKVYYGISKLNKVQKKPEISILYENGNNNPDKNLKMVKRWMSIVHVRNQTVEEMKDAQNKDRMFTKYGYFIDEKPWFGNLDKALQQNFDIESNHVSKLEREEIRNKLRLAFYTNYKRRPYKG